MNYDRKPHHEGQEEKEKSHDSSDSDSSEAESDSENILAPAPPTISLLVHKERKIKSFYDINACPHNLDDIREDRLYRFIVGYLDCMENRPQCYESYYSDTAVFSIILSEGRRKRGFTELSPLTLYEEKGTNIMVGKYSYWKNNVYEGIMFAFPFGFKAHVSLINTQQIDDDLFTIEMHGCCIGREGHSIPFDRTLVVKKSKCIYSITNDCVNLRD